MANLQVNQIRKHLTDNYIRFVDASDIKATDEDKDIHILSRAYGITKQQSSKVSLM